MKLIDVTMPLDEKTPAYPGDPRIEIRQIAQLQQNGWNEKRIQVNTHCGTHLDAPSHFVKDGKTIDNLPLNAFHGEGVLIDVRRKKITLASVKKAKIMPGSVVLFLTGQSDRRYQNYYENATSVPEEVAHHLVKSKIKAIGIDSFSPDTEPYPIHKILLPKGILIIENLINLKALLNQRFHLYYFPLRISGGDGAPCRVIAQVN